jgi:hypothetical protein
VRCGVLVLGRGTAAGAEVWVQFRRPKAIVRCQMQSAPQHKRMRTVSAERGIRTSKHRPDVPRVVEHEPRRGDVHPLPKAMLTRVLPLLPPYIPRAISAIELRARTSDIGDPYGTYHPRDALVRLYSVPFPDWPWDKDELPPNSNLAFCGAKLIRIDDRSHVHWDRLVDLTRFYALVLAHELGHHYVYRHRRKWSLPTTTHDHERRANSHIWRTGVQLAFKRCFETDASGQ